MSGPISWGITLWRFLWRTLFVLVGLAFLAPAIVTPLDLTTQAAFGAFVFVVCFLINLSKRQFVTLILVVTSTAVSTRYIFWRFTSTLTTDFTIDMVLGWMLMGAELYAFTVLLLGYLQTLWALPRTPAPLPPNLNEWPSVDVYIPTYNEPLDVVRTTVLAAKAIDWPADKLNIFILDDGRRDVFRAFAAKAGVGYIIRPDNKHAKAGNLNHAMKKTRGEFIAIFDCDHVPTRSFLQVSMGWFLKDKRLALLQTPHHFYSPDPFEKNLGTFRKVPNEGELFYGLIQRGNDVWNATFFCGSCAVIRRTAMEEVGGIAVETVTEDAHTALKMQRRGWNTAYIDIPQAAGLATESLSAHVGQRIRWARGMAQIFRIDNPLLGRGLTFVQRLCYLASMLHFFSGLPRLMFLIAPLSFLIFGLHIFNALPLMGLAYALPHLMHTTMTNSRTQGGFRHSLWSQVYETCLAYYISMVTTRALIDPKAGTFNVTAKGGRIEESYFERSIAKPYVFLIFANVIGIIGGIIRLYLSPGEAEYVVINVAWTIHNLVILLGTVAVAWEQKQLRSAPRVNVKLPAMIRLDDGRTVRCQTVDLARGGGQMKLASDLELSKNHQIWLTIYSTAEERALPAEVVSCSGSNLRVRFNNLTIDEEACLVQAMFSRADAWVNWKQGRSNDRPSLAPFIVAAHGVRGVIQIISGTRAAKQKQGEKSPAPNPAMAGS